MAVGLAKVLRSAYLPAIASLVAAASAGFFLRSIGDAEGARPTGGVLPVAMSSALCLGLWVAVWKGSRSLNPLLRLSLAALVPFLMGATAGVVWAAYGVVPGAALALFAVALGVAIRR